MNPILTLKMTGILVFLRDFIESVGSEIDSTREKFGVVNILPDKLPPGEFCAMFVKVQYNSRTM